MIRPKEVEERERADDEEWRHRQDQQQPPRAKWALSTILVILVIILVIVVGFWVGREAPMVYRNQERNHFEPSSAKPSQTILMCLSPEWRRICKAVIHERLNCVDPNPPEGSPAGAQHERTIGTRPITLPPTAPIYLENKCREFTVPATGCDKGPAAYTGLFEGWCNVADYIWPYRSSLGPIPLTIE